MEESETDGCAVGVGVGVGSHLPKLRRRTFPPAEVSDGASLPKAHPGTAPNWGHCFIGRGRCCLPSPTCETHPRPLPESGRSKPGAGSGHRSSPESAGREAWAALHCTVTRKETPRGPLATVAALA